MAEIQEVRSRSALGVLTNREARRQLRADHVRRTMIASAVENIDAEAIVEAHQIVRHTQVGKAKLSGVMDLATHAAGAWTSLAVKVDLHSQMSPKAIPGLGLIMQRALLEVDEALDDCSHKITGRGVIS